MDFLDPKKRRAHRNRLVIGYVLIGLIVVFVSLVISLIIYKGYSYNRKTGQIIQNGLVFVSSHPAGAHLTVDGQDKKNTNTKLLLPEGSHTIAINRDGYRPWQTSIDLAGASLRRLVYPLLIPQQLVGKTVDTLSFTPTFYAQTPDRRYFVLQQLSTANVFEVYDLSQKTAKAVTITLPTTLLTSKSIQSVKLIDWASDNKHALLVYTYKGGADYIVANLVKNETPVSLTKLMPKANISDVRFVGSSSTKVYFRDSKTLALNKLDIKSKSVTQVATDILAYKPYDSASIVVVAKSADKTDVQSKLEIINNDKTFVLRRLINSSNYQLAAGNYSDAFIIVAGSKEEGKFYVYKDALAALKKDNTSVVVPLDVIATHAGRPTMSLAPGNQIVSVQVGSKISYYDLESETQKTYDTGLALSSDQLFNWVDEHHLYAVVGGKTVVFDFDGQNKQTLTSASTGSSVAFDAKLNNYYTVSLTAKKKTVWSQTSLLIPSDQ